MAENKKGFILYADLIHTISELPDELKGKLFQLILDYVNDLNPEPTDLILKIAFNPIKLQLKRDLKIWESKIKQRSEAGKRSAESRSTKSTTVESRSTNPTVIVNVKDIVNVKVNNNNTIEFRKLKFSDTLKPFLDTYGKDFLNDFYNYWAEPNKSNTKFRYELEKTWDLKRRLETWAKNEKKFKTNFGNEKLGRADQIIQTHNEVKQYFDNLYKNENDGNSTNKD